MPPILRRGIRDDDLVALAGPDLVITPRTAVALLGPVRLHVPDLDPGVVFAVIGPAVLGVHRGMAAHATNSATTSTVTTTRTMSLRRLTCCRNGLNPTASPASPWGRG